MWQARGKAYRLFYDTLTGMMSWTSGRPPRNLLHDAQEFVPAVVKGKPGADAALRPVLISVEAVRLNLQRAVTTAFGRTQCSVTTLHPPRSAHFVGGLVGDDGEGGATVFMAKSLTFLVGQGTSTFVTVVVSAFDRGSPLLEGHAVVDLSKRSIAVSGAVSADKLAAVARNRLGRARNAVDIGQSPGDVVSVHPYRMPAMLATADAPAAVRARTHIVRTSSRAKEGTADASPLLHVVDLRTVFPGAVAQYPPLTHKPIQGKRPALEYDSDGSESDDDDTRTHYACLRVAPGVCVDVGGVHMDYKDGRAGQTLRVDVANALQPTPLQVAAGSRVSPWTPVLITAVARAVRAALKPSEEGAVRVKWGYATVDGSKTGVALPESRGGLHKWAAWLHHAFTEPGRTPGPSQASLSVTSATVRTRVVSKQ